MSKQQIVDDIATIVNFCIADANTYLYAKCQPSINEDIKKIPIGGGNFTVLLSTLVTIEFLATIDFLITSQKNDIYTDDEINKIKKTKDKLEDLIIKCIIVPKAGQPKDSSGKIFRKFLKKTSGITSISNKDAGKLQGVRNKLAHEFTPKILAAAAIPPVPGADFVNLILQYKNQNVFCLTSENTVGIDSNALNHKLDALLKHIIEKIEDLDENSDALKKIDRYIKNTK